VTIHYSINVSLVYLQPYLSLVNLSFIGLCPVCTIVYFKTFIYIVSMQMSVSHVVFKNNKRLYT